MCPHLSLLSPDTALDDSTTNTRSSQLKEQPILTRPKWFFYLSPQHKSGRKNRCPENRVNSKIIRRHISKPQTKISILSIRNTDQTHPMQPSHQVKMSYYRLR